MRPGNRPRCLVRELTPPTPSRDFEKPELVSRRRAHARSGSAPRREKAQSDEQRHYLMSGRRLAAYGARTTARILGDRARLAAGVPARLCVSSRTRVTAAGARARAAS